jgi:cell division inhibitor SulA
MVISTESSADLRRRDEQTTVNSTIETLSEGELDLVVGGIWDNPEQDKMNQNRAAQNGRDGTFGGSIGGGLIPGAGSHGGAIPVDYP